MMAHWAELDENNTVIRVLVGDNNDLAGDEGYQWLIDNLGGTWIKTSYNTLNGVHAEGGTPLRWTFAGVGYTYREDLDAFIAPSIYVGWVFDSTIMDWVAPVPKPDSGLWIWDNETVSWKEPEVE
jgi:hypothetical protein